MCQKMNGWDWVAWILLIIGGLNWGLVGLFNFDLVAAIFGLGWLAKLIYILVGLSAVYVVVTCGQNSDNHKPAAPISGNNIGM